MDVKRLDFPDRDLFILADGDWRGFRSGACAKEPETVEWLRRVAPGSVVWDVGASVGPYSLVAAALGAGQVVAFEPYGPSYGHLCSNISLNKMDGQIEAWPVRLAEYGGYMNMAVWPNAIGSGSHAPESCWKDMTLQKVISITAEDLLSEAGGPWPNHIKIDVDGAEMDVIEGGRTVWSQAQSVMVESTEKRIGDIAVILSACGLEQTGKWFRSGTDFNYLFERGK